MTLITGIHNGIMQFLNFLVLGNPLLNWTIAIGIFTILAGVLIFVKDQAIIRIGTRAIRGTGWSEIFVDVLGQTRMYAILVLSAWLASLVLNLTPGATVLLRMIMFTLLLLQVARWGNRLISLLVTREVKRRVGNNDESSTTVGLLGFFARVILWTVILLVVLDNLPNVRVDTLITSLGVTGLAVAIAVQRILSDVFASVSIALDKPFVIGDFIIVDAYQGTVENIGLKSTRIRSLFGEQIVVSNSDLLNSRIKNYKRMVDRRVVLNIKLAPSTSIEQLMRVPTLLQEIVQAQNPVRFGRAHFQSIGDGFYLYEIVYDVLSPDYSLYMDIQQNVNLAILNRFQQEGIPLAMA
jgi:small-conductance mechanosensitive channel